jgi:hypothetical protein
MTRVLAVIGLTIGLAICPRPAEATHIILSGTTIDAIDGVFGAGGGTFDGVLSPSPTWDWYVFAANAGDIITLETEPIAGQFDTGLSLVSDQTDGFPDVGDLYAPPGGNLNLLASDDDGGLGTLSLIIFNVTTSGTYAVAVGGFGGSTGNFRLSLTGNTASVPEPSLAILFATAILAARRCRRRT